MEWGDRLEIFGLARQPIDARREHLVEQARRLFGEYPAFENNTYTFLADYVPWANGDGMEHRNSTLLTSSTSLASNPGGIGRNGPQKTNEVANFPFNFSENAARHLMIVLLVPAAVVPSGPGLTARFSSRASVPVRRSTSAFNASGVNSQPSSVFFSG